jgi:ATP-binding cassette subfamily F protein 3
MLYRLDGVRKAFGPKEVLRQASWQHDPGRVVGLVGRNGAGKTTVLKIVAGLIEPDAGRRLVAGGTTFASLDQAVEPEGGEALRAFVAAAQESLRGLESAMRRLEEAIAAVGVAGEGGALEGLLAEHDEARERFERGGGWEADARVERMLLGVGLAREAWNRPVGELSGGQKHRAQIARLLLTDAGVLLLDEPTNHLDVAGMEFLEAWLNERKTAVAQSALVVSHDRAFLNGVADAIVEVAHGKLEEYPGHYDTYRKLKAERERLRAKEAEQQRKLIERTEEFIRRNIAGQKTKQAQGRRKMLARLERVEAPREDVNEVTFRFEEARGSGARVLDATNVVPGYDASTPLLSPVSFLLRRGEKVALWGPNGSGKTTLLKTLARKLPPLAGSIVLGTGVLTGYYDQEMGDLPYGARLLDVVMDLDPTMREGEARDFLALFDFRGDEVEQRIGSLSGGEKGRLSLARIVFGGANLLLLDEPTNHLDLDARERLEDALEGFEGSIVFVSHDRWFVDRIATHVLEIRGRDAELMPGNYSELARRRREEKERATEPAGARPGPRKGRGNPGAVFPEQSPASARAAKRLADRERDLRARRAEELLDEIAAMEGSLKDLDALLAAPDVYRDGEKAKAVKARREGLATELEARISEWEDATRKLEAKAP